MRTFNIEKDSMWGCATKNKFICNDSDKLVVLLPGMGYNLDKALMDYSKQLVLDLKFDYLGLEYGFQANKKEFDRNNKEEVRELALESLDVILSVIELQGRRHKKIIFIGKSLGTVLQNSLGEKIKSIQEVKIKDVYLTPVNKTVETGIREGSLVITGSKDALITKENIEKIKELNGLELVEVEGAGHSLCVKGEVLSSIEVLKESIGKIKNYLQRI
ncbi:alpha/beta fold hydrolase [Clostridium sp. B9]|uniref:alpha/beta fold hydrolase n=1 Tax=Clostridium sp. B9 TaxID=3423224 RepID=UPI003D2EBA80